MAKRKKTIAVFFGGRSNEHEISIITGLYCLNLLRGGNWDMVGVYLPPEGGMSVTDAAGVEEFARGSARGVPVYLREGWLVRRARNRLLCKIDCALNCCHGGAGEDGTLAALLAWNNVPSASPDMPVSALFMNKAYAKLAARGLGLNVLPSVTVGEWESADGARALGFPVVVKPATLGSSIGIRVAQNEEELERALELAFTLDHTALVERYVQEKRDINCAAWRKGGEVVLSECEEVFSNESILTFREKYEGTGERASRLPAQLPAAVREEIRAATKTVYEAFCVRGVVRADFLYAEGKVWFNELNTVPGSLASYLFGEKLTDARTFLQGLIEEGLSARTPKKRILTTGILQRGIFSGSKGCKRRKNLV